MKKEKKQGVGKKDYDDKKDVHNAPQQKRVVRSWGLATRLENKKMVKPSKKKKE